MIVCHKNKFIFIHNPKAAGTSFRNAIKKYHDHPKEFWGTAPDPFFGATVDLAHLRAWELPIVAPAVYEVMKDYTTLAFARDPEQRFISACFEHFRNFGDAAFLDMDTPGQQQRMESLIDGDLTIEKVISDSRYVHFSPQTWYFYAGRTRQVRHILPLLTDQDDFTAACTILELPLIHAEVRNRATRDRSESLLTPKLREFVRRFYAIDYALFGMHPHLTALLQPGKTAPVRPPEMLRNTRSTYSLAGSNRVG